MKRKQYNINDLIGKRILMGVNTTSMDLNHVSALEADVLSQHGNFVNMNVFIEGGKIHNVYRSFDVLAIFEIIGPAATTGPVNYEPYKQIQEIPFFDPDMQQNNEGMGKEEMLALGMELVEGLREKFDERLDGQDKKIERMMRILVKAKLVT